MLVTMLACFLRSAWVFYPTWARTQAWFVADYSFGSLLRVPQVLWYCAFLNLLVAWLSILETAAYASRGRWLRRIALGLIVIGITSTVPVTVLDVVEHVASGWLHTFVNLLCILTGNARVPHSPPCHLLDSPHPDTGCIDTKQSTGLLILPFGCSVGCRIAHTLQQRQRAKPTASQVDLLNRTTNTIMMTTVVFTSLGLLATSMVAIVTLANFTPQRTPGIFMAYLYLVHLLCEVALAIVLLRASHIGSRKPLGFRRHAVRSAHGWTLRQQRANSNGSSSNSMTGGKYTPPVFFSDMVATTEGRHRSSELSQAHLGSSSEPYHSHSERAVRSSGSLLEPGGAVVVPVRASTRSVSLDSAAQVLVQAEDFHVAGDL